MLPTPSPAADDNPTTTIPLNGPAVVRTPRGDSQPNNGNVIPIRAWRTPLGSAVGQTARRRSGCDIDTSTDSDEPVTGPDEWWNQALARFKAYIELSAVDTDPLEAEDQGKKEI